MNTPSPATSREFENATIEMPALRASGAAARTDSACRGPKISCARDFTAAIAAFCAPAFVPQVSKGMRTNDLSASSNIESCAASSMALPNGALAPLKGSKIATRASFGAVGCRAFWGGSAAGLVSPRSGVCFSMTGSAIGAFFATGFSGSDFEICGTGSNLRNVGCSFTVASTQPVMPNSKSVAAVAIPRKRDGGFVAVRDSVAWMLRRTR